MKIRRLFSWLIVCSVILVFGCVQAGETTAPKTDMPPASEDSDTPTPQLGCRCGVLPPPAPTIDSAYLGLASGVLTFARAGVLPKGIILQAGEFRITAGDLDAEIAKSSAEIRPQLMKNAFFLLEQMSTEKLLLQDARAAALVAQKDLKGMSDKEIILQHLKPIQEEVAVTDSEVKDFYEKNKDMCGDATLEQVKNDLAKYVLGQKQQDAINEHIRAVGQRLDVIVDKPWLDQQYVMACDNPADKARSSGLPSLIDFGSTGCRPCDMMAPILATLKKKYENKLNVLFIHVGEEKILGARYGIQSIPVQIFFDKQGKEVFRHTGFFPQAEIEKKLSEMEVK